MVIWSGRDFRDPLLWLHCVTRVASQIWPQHSLELERGTIQLERARTHTQTHTPPPPPWSQTLESGCFTLLADFSLLLFYYDPHNLSCRDSRIQWLDGMEPNKTPTLPFYWPISAVCCPYPQGLYNGESKYRFPVSCFPCLLPRLDVFHPVWKVPVHTLWR